MKLLKLSALLIICVCLSGVAFGQETTGVIEGTVVDAQGARIATRPRIGRVQIPQSMHITRDAHSSAARSPHLHFG